jgi:ABC-type Fe3+/spermidine/putrescine transport system ATPase subunit
VTALVRLEDVRVDGHEQPRLVLDELEVRLGETLAVLGPTGAGKSTLLGVLNTLTRPSHGRYLWRGAPVELPAPLSLRRRMAMAFQDPLPLGRSVFANVAYGLKLRGVRGTAIAERVQRTLRLFGIADLAQRPAHAISGGEAQRTALARAVVLEPEFLLLDEPLASLDPDTRERLGDELRRIIQGCGLTCVWVTHDQSEARAIADRVAVLDRGRLLQVGEVAEVFGRPATAQVARFVRVRNLLVGRIVAAEAGRARVAVAGTELEVASPLAAGSAVLVCVRPEDVSITVAEDDARDALVGTIVERRPRGALVELTIDCGEPVVAAVPGRIAAGIGGGARVCVRLAAEAAHLVPAEDGTPAAATPPANETERDVTDAAVS